MRCCYGRWRRCRLWSRPRSVEQPRCCSASQQCSCNWAGPRCRSAQGAMDGIGIPRDGKRNRCRVILIRYAMRLSRVGESAWLKAQAAGVQSLYQRQLVRGKVYAVDGRRLGDELRLVDLASVASARPIMLAWRVLSGAASEEGKEAEVTRALIEQVLEVAGPNAISLLLADALYADGPLLAWLKYRKGIDALVRLPEDRLLYQVVEGLADAHLSAWTHHRYVRTVQGHKHIREVEVTAAGDLTSWDGFTEAAATAGVPDATLWACLIRDVTTPEAAQEPPIALVSTRRWQHGFAALQAYRPRWHIEDDIYRELKEGWGLEKQHWGRDLAAARGRVTLTCLAFNTAQVYRLRAGQQLAALAIRRLRRRRERALGNAPAVIYLAGCYGVFALEELLGLLGAPARESLLPDVRKSSFPNAPT